MHAISFAMLTFSHVASSGLGRLGIGANYCSRAIMDPHLVHRRENFTLK
jgi:hypothetical protein